MSPATVRIVLTDHDGRVLMLQRAGDDDVLPGAWELPGGGIDPGETAREAAARELHEEAGVAVGADALAEWGVFERAGRRTAFFAAGCAAGDCRPALSHEHDDWRWARGPAEVQPLTPSAQWAVARHRWPGADGR